MNGDIMLDVKDLRFTYGEKQLFLDVSFKIFQGEHVGLVGANGSGKTTLLNLIAHRLSPDAGTIVWDKNISFSYLDQHLVIHDHLTIKQYLYNVYEHLFVLEEQMNQLYESLATIDVERMNKVLMQAERIQNDLETQGFYRIKSKISNVINGLGIDVTENKLLKHLSGGQRAKVFLGKMLLEEKEMLLLDEPTNFLDVMHIDWLSRFLQNYKYGFLVVSHDHHFLNDICQVILALENKQIIRYRGNYDAYILQRDMNQATYIKEYEKQQKLIKRTEEFIQKNITRATTTKRAQSRRKMLEKLDVLEKPQTVKKATFQFDFTHSFHKKSIRVKQLTIGYDKPILSNINLDFEFGHKYVIVGKNGIGKTTFIKTLLGIIPPLVGKFEVSELNDIVYFAQEVKIEDETPIAFIRNDYPKMTDLEIRTLLAQYGIVGPIALQSMLQLSGGETTKVRFAKLSLKASNLLILDEPTNHLDRQAKQSLYRAIETYSGTVLLVSHDKTLYKQLQMTEIKFS